MSVNRAELLVSRGVRAAGFYTGPVILGGLRNTTLALGSLVLLGITARQWLSVGIFAAIATGGLAAWGLGLIAMITCQSWKSGFIERH